MEYRDMYIFYNSIIKNRITSEELENYTQTYSTLIEEMFEKHYLIENICNNINAVDILFGSKTCVDIFFNSSKFEYLLSKYRNNILYNSKSFYSGLIYLDDADIKVDIINNVVNDIKIALLRGVGCAGGDTNTNKLLNIIGEFINVDEICFVHPVSKTYSEPSLLFNGKPSSDFSYGTIQGENGTLTIIHKWDCGGYPNIVSINVDNVGVSGFTYVCNYDSIILYANTNNVSKGSCEYDYYRQTQNCTATKNADLIAIVKGTPII